PSSQAMKYSPPPPRTRARSLPIPSDGVAGIDTAASASMRASGCALREPVSPDARNREESGGSRGHHPPPVKANLLFASLSDLFPGISAIGGLKRAGVTRREIRYALKPYKEI